jgi:hypothetical protein
MSLVLRSGTLRGAILIFKEGEARIEPQAYVIDSWSARPARAREV